MELVQLRGLEKLAGDKAGPLGIQHVADGFLLMALASLRFPDTRAIFELWKNDTASRGRSRVSKRRGRPIIFRATPRNGSAGPKAWVAVFLRSWANGPRMKGGRCALFPFIDDDRGMHTDRAASCNAVLPMSENLRYFRICAALGGHSFCASLVPHMRHPIGVV